MLRRKQVNFRREQVNLNFTIKLFINIEIINLTDSAYEKACSCRLPDLDTEDWDAVEGRMQHLHEARNAGPSPGACAMSSCDPLDKLQDKINSVAKYKIAI